MASSAGNACMWSGVETVTASNLSPSFSYISRKSAKCGVPGKAASAPLKREVSMSQKATNLALGCDPTSRTSERPLLLTPTAAIWSLELTFWQLTSAGKPATASAEVCTKLRRERGFLMGVHSYGRTVGPVQSG